MSAAGWGCGLCSKEPKYGYLDLNQEHRSYQNRALTRLSYTRMIYTIIFFKQLDEPEGVHSQPYQHVVSMSTRGSDRI